MKNLILHETYNYNERLFYKENLLIDENII